MLHYFCFKNPNKNVSWLTFIHGAGGNSSIWSQQIRFFKNFYHLLLIDLRGHGKSISHEFDEIYTFESLRYILLYIAILAMFAGTIMAIFEKDVKNFWHILQLPK